MIYLNNAAYTKKKPPCCTDAAPAAPEDVKALMARLLTVKNPQNIYLANSGREALSLALDTFCKGGHIVSTGLEAGDTMELLASLEQSGTTVSRLPHDPYYKPIYEQLESLITPDTKAIFCTHGDSVTGNVIDLPLVCNIARRHKLPVIADGRQTAGGVDVNLEESGVDVYVFTGEKALMGPDTIGGICLRPNLSSPTLAAGETIPDAQTLASFAAAIAFILEKGIYGVAMLPHRLAKRFFESSKAMRPVTVYGDYGTKVRLPYVAITAEGFTAEEIKKYFSDRNVVIEVIDGKARFSFGYLNNRRQVTRVVLKLMDMLGIDDMYLVP